MALPNLLFYYWAANIRVILYWMKNGDAIPSQVTLKEISTGHVSMISLLCARLPLLRSISRFNLNPVVIHSLKIWHFSLTELSLVAPPQGHCMFTPQISDEAFCMWSKLGIMSMYNLFCDNVFRSFEQLVQKSSIPRTHFYKDTCSLETLSPVILTSFPHVHHHPSWMVFLFVNQM